MKKLLALVLTLCMVAGVMSALAEGFTPAASYDVGERKFDGGEITTVAAVAGGGEVDTVAYAGEAGKDYTDEKVYTFNDYIAATSSMDWNPHTWETNDDGNMIAYVPIYCANTRQPLCFNTPGADDIHFSMDNAFWVCNWVSNMVYPRYSLMFPTLKQVRDSLDASFASLQPIIEAEAIAQYGSAEQALVAHMTDYSCLKAEQMMDRWRRLAYFLIVKYNDMVERPDRDGQFYYNENGLGATVKRPGMAERFAREMNRHGGQRMKMPK